MKKIAFTLVELIVVITILAILATIGFVSFSGYLAGARDTNRIAQLKSMSDALELYRTKKDLPIPDDKVDVQASGTTIAYQGYIGANVLETIEYTEKGLDPKDKVYFSYYLTKNKKYFQLLAFLEEANTDVVASNIFNNGQAVDYSGRFPKVTGKKLGILTDANNTPIQEIMTIQTASIFDISNVLTTVYNAIISDEEIISGSGTTLSYSHAQGSCKRIKQINGGSSDGVYTIDPESNGIGFQVYCDMTTDGGGWTLVAFFNKEGMAYDSGAVGDVSNIDNKGVKLSDIIINKTNSKQFRFQGVGTKECREFLYTKSFYWDYSGIAKASTKGLYSIEYSSDLTGYISNSGWTTGYILSAHGVRDSWLRDNANTLTRWETTGLNPCGYTSWYHAPSYTARADIRMWVQ